MAAKPRRWYQFSILAALILTTVVALLVALFVVPAQRQRAAVAQILAAGGQLTYEHERIGPLVPGSGAAPPGPAWLRNIIGPDYFETVIGVAILNNTTRPEDVAKVLTAATRLPKLESLYIQCAAFRDDDVEQVARLHRLQRLSIAQPIAPAQVAQLADLSRLSGLTLMGDFAGTDIEPLVRLPELGTMTLNGRITADELEAIAQFRQLTLLNLPGRVADADMPKLAPLTRLTELYCTQGPVTRALVEISEVECQDASLRDVMIDYLAIRHSIKFRMDERAISAAGIDLDNVVFTATVSGIPLGQLLTELLEPAGLGYRIEDDVLSSRRARKSTALTPASTN